ncbi:MAG: MFS transporter, partial [Tepidisphaeraceae bacterium]
LHLLSAILTLAAGPVFHASWGGKDATYWCLYVAMFMFSLGNGLGEAVINPLTATLYPKNKTHWLNILHAAWPAGLILGAAFGYLFVGKTAHATQLRWEIPMLVFMVPTVLYGVLTLKNKFPVSEASAAGVGLGTMIATILTSPMFLFLIFIHALVGYQELGTDSWIQNIMKNVIPGNETLLFIYTSGLMFILRFFAGPIVHKINPLGLLFVSACCAALGLFSLGMATTGLLVVAAATIYGVGKTFLWPTMLGVAGERFPKAGALGMGMLGGVGMLSAGFLAGPGIGYKQDYNASKDLKATAPAAYDRYKAAEKNSFLFFPAIQGLDGSKVAIVEDTGKGMTEEMALNAKNNKKDENLDKLNTWWTTAKLTATQDKEPVIKARLYGGRMALKLTALVPTTMAVCYLLLVAYFVSKGGYKAIHLDANGNEIESGH